MDQSQPFPGKASIVRLVQQQDKANGNAAFEATEDVVRERAELTLVSGSLAFSSPDQLLPAEWEQAIESLTGALGIDAHWVSSDQPVSLIEKARRAVGTGNALHTPAFAPWRIISPTVFQLGKENLAARDAQWVASYLFDFGAACPAANGSVDLVLMSPCPQTCVSDDPVVGPLPRLNTLASMVRAAADEGRKSLAIVVREAARATLATRLLGFDASLNEASINVEFVSIEEAVMKMQRGSLEWDAVIAMPELRGVVFAMLQQATGISGPWPMLWFDRGLRMVTCEALDRAGVAIDLDATALVHSLALFAHHSASQYAAQQFFQSWATVRDSGVVTPARSSSAPYVNEIEEAAFIDRAASNGVHSSRPLPSWKGIGCEDRQCEKSAQPVRLSLVQ